MAEGITVKSTREGKLKILTYYREEKEIAVLKQTAGGWEAKIIGVATTQKFIDTKEAKRFIYSVITPIPQPKRIKRALEKSNGI